MMIGADAGAASTYHCLYGALLDFGTSSGQASRGLTCRTTHTSSMTSADHIYNMNIQLLGLTAGCVRKLSAWIPPGAWATTLANLEQRQGSTCTVIKIEPKHKFTIV
jgi:hypothetical protein